MENITMTNKGTIKLGSKVMVSDPCYGLNTWCQGVLDNVLAGEYECTVEHSNEGEWGIRVSAIEVTHKNYKGKFMEMYPESFEVGVDSGQAGIFDYDYYCKYHTDANERDHVDDDWYDRICNTTESRIKNPYYEEFEFKRFDFTDKSIENMKAVVEYEQKLDEYMKDRRKWIEYKTIPDGNTIDRQGFVSSSGYGDGGYICWTARNADNQVVSIRVEFITEDEDEEDE